jgi:hypothetical protein
MAPEPAKQQQEAPKGGAPADTADIGPVGVADVVALPDTLQAVMGALPREVQARPVVLKLAPTWSRTRREGLLASPTTASLDTDDQRTLRGEAFDLLDALTRSGALVYEDVDVHVVVEVSSSFTRSVVATVIEENVNVLDRVEQLGLTVVSALHGVPLQALRA